MSNNTKLNRITNGTVPVMGWLAARPLLSELMIIALTVVFGLQVFRVLVPSLTWLLGDRFGLGAIEFGAVALIVFTLSFFAGGLRSLFGNRWSIIITAGGLGLLRLTMQFHWQEPLVNLVPASNRYGDRLRSYIYEYRNK